MRSLSFLFLIGILAFVTAIVSAVRSIDKTDSSRFLALQREPAAPKTSGAKEALDFWHAARAYPGRSIPEAAYFRGFEYSLSSLLPVPSALHKGLAIPRWQSIGPHNIGGRTLAIAINPRNPNTIYAGSASGGLWRSYTGGVGVLAWRQIRTGFPVLSVKSIAIHPIDTSVIYIGTGEVYGHQGAQPSVHIRTTRGSYGIGILKTTDAGQTWTKSLDWTYQQRRGVQAVRINSKNPNTIWAATTEGTYRSRNAGASWEFMHPVVMAMDIAINPIDTNYIYIACGGLGSTGNGLYRSINGGTSWERMVNGLPESFGGKANFALFQSSPNIIFVSIGNGSFTGAGTWLCKSTDHGATWTIVSLLDYSTHQGWYSHYVGVNPGDSSKVICAGIDIWKSTSGGMDLRQKSYWNKWTFGRTPAGGPEGPSDYAHADHHAIAYHPSNPNIIYFATDGGVFRSLNGGETFEGLNGGLQTTQFYGGYASSATDSLLAIGGMQDNATAIYDGSKEWIRVLGGDGAMTAIAPSNPQIMYGSTQYLNLRRSLDRGVTWTNIPPPNSTTTAFVGPFVLHPTVPDLLYAARDKVYRSVNRGTSWQTLNSNRALDQNPVLALAVSRTSPDTIYAATAPESWRVGIFVSADGGASWTNVTRNLPDRYFMEVAVDPHNAAIAYVSLGGFGTSHLYKTSDMGKNWIDIGSKLPDVPTSAIAIDPLYPNHIYAGNDLGVYLTTNRGSTWHSFNDGLPDAIMVSDLSISASNRKLRAVTHGNGVYETSLLSPFAVPPDAPPAGFRLDQNFPNPFNAFTAIPFSVQERVHVKLMVYDLTGKPMATLLDREVEPGSYVTSWEARGLVSGVFFARLEAGNYKKTRKMIYLK